MDQEEKEDRKNHESDVHDVFQKTKDKIKEQRQFINWFIDLMEARMVLKNGYSKRCGYNSRFRFPFSYLFPLITFVHYFLFFLTIGKYCLPKGNNTKNIYVHK